LLPTDGFIPLAGAVPEDSVLVKKETPASSLPASTNVRTYFPETWFWADTTAG